MTQKPKLDTTSILPPTEEQIKAREALKYILKILDKQGDLNLNNYYYRLTDVLLIPISGHLVRELLEERENKK
jgi:hypothetical protein